MTMFQMYLFTRADKLLIVFGISSIILSFVFSAATIALAVTHAENIDKDEKKISKRFFFSLLPPFLFSLVGYVLIPSQKELAAIVVVPKILSEENVDKIQRIGAEGVDIVKLATEYTKGILENKAKEIQK